MRAFRKFLRFVLNLQGFVAESAEILNESHAVVVHGRRRKSKPRCSIHPREELGGELRSSRKRWRHLDMPGCRTYIEADVREGRCRKCNGRRMESVSWAEPRAEHTKAFDLRVASLVQVADKSATSRVFGIAWRTVGRIVERVVKNRLPNDLLDDLVAITVDETSHKRGHRYITVVTDLERDRVVWVGEGKSGDTLRKFFNELGEARAKSLELVAIDMGEAYQGVVRELAPKADIVFDRFHVVKLLLDAVDEVRRAECRALEGPDKKALKNTRFPLLRNPKYVRPQDEAAIAKVLATNTRLGRAYQMRVDFEALWDCESEESAGDFINRWTTDVLRSRLEPMKKFARTVRKYAQGILMFFRYPGQTSAKAEGMNNKIKLLMHRAFGFGSLSGLTSMIFLCCSGIEL